jgi:hypothetical protein
MRARLDLRISGKKQYSIKAFSSRGTFIHNANSADLLKYFSWRFRYRLQGDYTLEKRKPSYKSHSL